VTERVCLDCPAPLGRTNTSGRCRRCLPKVLASDPARRARQVAGIARHFACPKVREAAAKRLRQYSADPALNEKRREIGKARWRSGSLKLPAVSPEQYAENGRKVTATRLAWCPPEWRDRYRALLRKNVAPAAECKAMILQEIAAAERARLAKLSPLDRQLERVRSGAKLIEVRPMPAKKYAFTLGGVSG
jgi:hypothetical protein